MKRTYFGLVVLLSVVPLLMAHEFWLEPNKFIYKVGEDISLRLLVGENFEGENWNGNNKSIQSFQLHLNDAMDDLSYQVTDSVGDSLQFSIHEEGTYMITYNSTNKYIELKPEDFQNYLKEDGLQNAIDYRKENGELDSVGREFYQRSVKTIFQVGEKNHDFIKKQTNLPLDIIPLTNPYKVKKLDKPEGFTVRILFQKQPLANAVIKVWHRQNNKTAKVELKSDEKGEINFPVRPSGIWMVSTVKMVRLPKDSTAQWQSYWGSLTFGYTK